MKDEAANAAAAVQLVHDIPGRVRLRLPRRGREAKEATAIADHLARLDGMIDVQVRPLTGSVLCRYDADTLSLDAILTALRDLVRSSLESNATQGGVAKGRVRQAGKRSSVAHAVTRAFRGYNRDVLGATEGRLDLGILAVMAFFAAGVAEVVTTRRLPAPPWFNLAWWAFQTFIRFEGEEIAGAHAEGAEPVGRARAPRTRREGPPRAARG